jgi:hypothetical protein
MPVTPVVRAAQKAVVELGVRPKKAALASVDKAAP